MSSPAFDTLRHSFPESANAIGRLEQLIVSAFDEDPASVIDDVDVEQRLQQPAGLVQRLLVELVVVEVLTPRAFWLCSQQLGTAREAGDVKEFPPSINCPRCGLQHEFSASSIEIKFVAAPTFLAWLEQHQDDHD